MLCFFKLTWSSLNTPHLIRIPWVMALTLGHPYTASKLKMMVDDNGLVTIHEVDIIQ
jgi:hypothetical protein